MSKVDSLLSTPATGLNRRGLLAGAGGIAAVGALAAVPALAADNAAEHSPEFLKWYALASRTGEALAASNTWEEERVRQGKERPQDEYPISLHWDAVLALEEPIYARPARFWMDAIELALIALYWSECGDRTMFGLSNRPPDLEGQGDVQGIKARAHLVHAVLTMAKGGANV
jgi:hypothetical protein